MRRVLFLLGLAAIFVFAFAAPAFAVGNAGETRDVVIPVQWGAIVALVISSLIVPYLTAFLVAESAHPFVATVVSAVLAGLASVSAWAIDVQGVPDWKYAVSLFLGIFTGALVVRKQVDSVGHTERGTPKSLYKVKPLGLAGIGARAA